MMSTENDKLGDENGKNRTVDGGSSGYGAMERDDPQYPIFEHFKSNNPTYMCLDCYSDEEKKDLWGEYLTAIKKKGYIVLRVSEDENSLFSAISQAISGFPDFHEVIKKEYIYIL